VRTTVDLDPDVDARLRAISRERGVPLRVVINDALRAALHPAARETTRYTVPTRRLGIKAGVDVDKALSLAAELEDDAISRKLELRK
jgi:predicted transcriptional regulator